MDFRPTQEQELLREAVSGLASKYGHRYFQEKTASDAKPDELWLELGEAGFLGVHLPEDYGGGGMGISELAIVCEEVAAAGCPLLMMLVSPAICGTLLVAVRDRAPAVHVAPAARLRPGQDGLCHHRARCRLEFPPDLDDGAARR